MQKSLFLSLFLPLLLSCHSPGASVLAGHFSSHFCKQSYSITESYSHVHTNDSRLQCSAYHRERTRQPSVPSVLHAALHKDDLFQQPPFWKRQATFQLNPLRKKFLQAKDREKEGKSYPWWFITAKVVFVISSHFWAHGSWTWPRLECPEFQVWGC